MRPLCLSPRESWGVAVGPWTSPEPDRAKTSQHKTKTGHAGRFLIDWGTTYAALRRRTAAPTMTKPPSIKAYVSGSGTAVTESTEVSTTLSIRSDASRAKTA